METARLMPLSESEKERRPGRFLSDLLAGAVTPVLRPGGHMVDPAGLGRRLVSGGYPEPLARSQARARQWHRQYIQSIVDRDVLDVGRVRDANGVARLLQLLAVRNGELLNTSGLSRELGLDRTTVREYIAVLERLFPGAAPPALASQRRKAPGQDTEDACARQRTRCHAGRVGPGGTGSQSGTAWAISSNRSWRISW